MKTMLNIALPKGRLGEKVYAMFEKAGFPCPEIKESTRKLIFENEEAGIRKKPAPDSLLAVMERLGADTHSTVYVGDSEVDIQTAQNAGVDCISVTWGFKDKDFLVDNGATVLVDSVEELLEKIS